MDLSKTSIKYVETVHTKLKTSMYIIHIIEELKYKIWHLQMQYRQEYQDKSFMTSISE